MLVHTEVEPWLRGEVPSPAVEPARHPRVLQHCLLLHMEKATAGYLYTGRATTGYWALLLVCERAFERHKPEGVETKSSDAFSS